MKHAYTRRTKKPAVGGEPAAEIKLTRHSPEVRARRAQTMLDNPDIRAQFDKVRTQLINDIELAELDGSAASEQKALENIRKLQALHAVKAQILQPILALQGVGRKDA